MNKEIPVEEKQTTSAVTEQLMPTSASDQPVPAAFFLIALYVATVFVRPQEYLPAVMDWPITTVLILTSFLVWLGGQNYVLQAPQFYLLAALFLYSPVTVVMAHQGFAAAVEVVTMLAPLYLTFLLIAATALSRKRMRLMMWLMVGGAVLFSVHGIQQKFTGVGWTGEVPILGRIRYIGIFNDPNDVGLSLITAIPMCMYLLRTSKRLFVKLLLTTGVGAVLWGISLTDSRGTILALGAILGVYSWRRYGVFKTMIVAAMAIPLMFMLSSRLDTISPGEESAHGRVEAWYEGILMVRESPIFGVGLDLFSDHHFRTAHNSYVLVLAEQGIPGYFLWFSFFGTCIMVMYLLQKQKKTVKPAWQVLTESRLEGKAVDLDFPAQKTVSVEQNLAVEDQAIARVLFLSFVGFATASFFLSRSYSMQLFLLCGMAVAHYQGTRMRNPGLTAYRFFDHFWFWAFASGASVIFLYLTVAVLLRMA